MVVDFSRIHENVADLAGVLDDQLLGRMLVAEVPLKTKGFGSLSGRVATQGTSQVLSEAVDVEGNRDQFTRANEVVLRFVVGITGSSILEHPVAGRALVSRRWTVVIHQEVGAVLNSTWWESKRQWD